MPSEFVHLFLAGRVADVLPLSAADRPSFALGSVAPDVSNLLGLPRRTTHYRDDPNGDEVSGAVQLLSAHPELASHRLSSAGRALVAGCLCHLIADEQEVLVVHRPHTSRAERHAGGRQARRELRTALLVVMERRAASTGPWLPSAVTALRAAVAGHAGTHHGTPEDVLPFAPLRHVLAWAQLVLSVAALPPGLDRLLRFRALPPAEVRRDGTAEDFPRRYAAVETELLRRVPDEALEAFERVSVTQSAAFVRAYLTGSPLPVPEGTVNPT
ncbi:MAG: hypothetical protein AVDCRST_MAG77-4660 [uncultured Chloroflexi bacterium]|uniref:Phospholipase C/D domain-containing protein n=1 Tax=uncultured Chloroflexota bacterium TaxID=166587 RepID=A0A6J4JY35_9CHLR|nr:MAG: hypothetical protein AVDCRST_MAG77-4660 [uncultured Chloroflexota bacterium]